MILLTDMSDPTKQHSVAAEHVVRVVRYSKDGAGADVNAIVYLANGDQVYAVEAPDLIRSYLNVALGTETVPPLPPSPEE